MDRECENAGSSWCVDFDCKDCPVRKPSSRTQANVTQHKAAQPSHPPFRKCIRDNQDCDQVDWVCEECERKQIDAQGFESTRLPDKNITFHEIGSVYYWLAVMQFANYQVALKSFKEELK